MGKGKREREREPEPEPEHMALPYPLCHTQPLTPVQGEVVCGSCAVSLSTGLHLKRKTAHRITSVRGVGSVSLSFEGREGRKMKITVMPADGVPFKRKLCQM